MPTYEEIFPSIKVGSMLHGDIPKKYQWDFAHADMNKWGIAPVEEV